MNNAAYVDRPDPSSLSELATNLTRAMSNVLQFNKILQGEVAVTRISATSEGWLAITYHVAIQAKVFQPPQRRKRQSQEEPPDRPDIGTEAYHVQMLDGWLSDWLAGNASTLAGYNITEVEVLSCTACQPDWTMLGTSNLTWPRTEVGGVAVPDQICVSKLERSAFVACLGNRHGWSVLGRDQSERGLVWTPCPTHGGTLASPACRFRGICVNTRAITVHDHVPMHVAHHVHITLLHDDERGRVLTVDGGCRRV
ncbi:PREDICTED: uncharacterized protein LOC106818891 [Priapulus caudatus]|uniref:Uncharacterized protein LOC106818891 n=1 Tax=Priapulus caudatus TaxID=37621 RepID=A0ABM1F3M5_PRICU|nr:PREDICTED: uncharacterized protein LOC106818891 [Priapulus caudatus]